MQSFQTHEELERIPNTSGLYYFYDQNDKLLYIGKAKNLHLRISDHLYLEENRHNLARMS